MINRRLLLLLVLFTSVCITSKAQDLNQIGKANLFSYSGGITANTVFYEGTGLRDPFTYVFNGNLNFNISGIYNIPLSFAYSNQKFSTNQPFQFNRLSIHPSYKWVTAHIGDVSMNFSPYTLSGHQFTGLGLDLTPKGKFKVSAMYGRFIRPVEYQEALPENTPAYKRIGYGLKTEYQLNKGRIGISIFKAKDELNSLSNPVPLDSGVVPKENLVISIDGSLKLFDTASLDIEYASSAVTENLNTDNFEGSLGLFSSFFNEKLSTSYYNALNVSLNYPVGNGSLGVGYERIDPDYKTLGAYFFNNDLENITANATQTLFDSKVSVSVNAGLQRDNLDKTKSNDLKKIVTAVNLNIKASEKTTIATSYSNFQSFTNIRNQFDYINELTQYDNIDTLNYKQLTRNANLNVSHILSNDKRRKQNVNLNLSIQETEDLQEQAFTGEETPLNNSQLFNSVAAYTLAFPEKTLSFSAAFNATLSKTKDLNSIALGPTLVVSKQLFDERVRSTFSASYNTNSNDGIKQTDIYNFRFSAGYKLLEKHQFNLSLLSLFRNNITQSKSNDFTANLSYSYAFASGDWKLKLRAGDKKIKEKNAGLPRFKLRYREQIYEGNAPQVLRQIQPLREDGFPNFKRIEVDKIQNDIILLQNEKANDIRDKFIDYLDAIYHYLDFKEKYDDMVYKSVMLLQSEARRIDGSVEEEFTELLYKIQNHKFKATKPEDLDANDPDFKEYETLYNTFVQERQRFVGHRWMQTQIDPIQTVKQFKKDKDLKNFINTSLDKVYKVYFDSNDLEKTEAYLLIELIEYYQELAKGKTDPTKYKLKYTLKKD